MRKITLFVLLLALFFSACGPTTRPADLAVNRTPQTILQSSGSSSAFPISPVLGTEILLPLIIRGNDGSPTPLPTSSPAPPSPTATFAPTATVAPTATPTLTVGTEVSFAVIGDFGSGNDHEAEVAALVSTWEPDFIITTGDNNYTYGEAETIDANIGQFYHSYIYPYLGTFGEGADQNRFFPSLGNHDYWNPDKAQPYLDYFTLPGNERYYDFTWGPVHFFALNSDGNEPDGISSDSKQAAWLQEKMSQSTTPWQVVFFHAAPYSSGLHGSSTWMRWPFKEWGADVVLAGHDHIYERLSIDGQPYFVNGLGGGAIYSFGDPIDGSQVRYNEDHGAMLVDATDIDLTFNFISAEGVVVDTFTIEK